MDQLLTEYNINFSKFKNIYEGRAGVLFATGPTINNYTPILDHSETINIGLNWIFNNKLILDNLDYYFFGSGYHFEPGTSIESERVKEYRNNINNLDSNIIKFASVYRQSKVTGLGNITPDAARNINAIPFDCQSPHGSQSFIKDIDKYQIFGLSIIFPALQFMLYTGMKDIYLIGVDANLPRLPESWMQAKHFINDNYPSTTLHSVNPVALKGYFNDIYS